MLAGGMIEALLLILHVQNVSIDSDYMLLYLNSPKLDINSIFLIVIVIQYYYTIYLRLLKEIIKPLHLSPHHPPILCNTAA